MNEYIIHHIHYIEIVYYFLSSAASLQLIFFIFIGLFVPHDENELDALKSKIVQVYLDTPRFIRLGIKQPAGLGVAEGWYWGSGRFTQGFPYFFLTQLG